MNKKLASIAAVICMFMVVMFCIFMTEGVIGFHYTDVNKDIIAYSNLITNAVINEPSIEKCKITDGFVIGSAFALTLSMLFIYLANGKLAVLLLSGYFLIRAIILTLLFGYSVEVLTGDIFTFYSFDVPILILASKFLLLWFTLLIFNIKTRSPKAYLVIRSVCWALFLYLPVGFVLPMELSFYLSIAIEIAIGLLLIGLGIHLIQKNRRLSILFTAFVVTQFVFDLFKTISLLGFNIDVYSEYSYLYSCSFWLSGCFTVFMLSRGYYYHIQDKEIAEYKTLASLKRSESAQAELLILQEENQEKLESRVQERTLELNIALQELEIVNKELEEKNTLDDLTGLYNRRYYDQKIVAEHRRSRRNLTPLSLVVIDIDHFKRVNDTYGHLVGDHCLIWVASKIKDVLGRVTDLGCRYGGEEFCLILPETDIAGAKLLAETLRVTIGSEVFVYEDKKIPLTISCGISTYWQQADITPVEIFAAADEALYKAKKAGRNQVQQEILTGNPES